MKTVTESAAGARTGSRRQPEQTRQAILDAAVREFANEGVDGARTDAIARAAGVNKALLYYYFHDKDALYGAVLDRVFSGLKRAIDAVLDEPLPPRQKVLSYAGAHFDYIAQSPLYPRLVQRGMMSPGRTGSPQVSRAVKQYLAPIFRRLGAVVAEGIRAGEFRPVDPVQFIPSVVALIVFYFGVQPVFRQVTGTDPLSPKNLAARRAAVLDFISAALFAERQNGVAVPALHPQNHVLPGISGRHAGRKRRKGVRA
jgi:TetR/AcrR family transcriptional regulator